MRKKLLNNLGLKLISLVLAFLLWFMVVQTTDPKDDKDMGNIPVMLVNTELFDKENKVYEVLDNSDLVRVTVYAPRSVLKTMRNSDIIAEADVSKLTDINTVPITFTSVNGDTVDIRGGHEVVRLTVEDKESKYVSLVANTVGEVAEGYIVSTLTPDQNRIEVSGPKSLVQKVKYAGAMIDVSNATDNVSGNMDIRLYDSEGNQIESVRLVKNVDYVKLDAEVLAVKEVPVKLEVTGEPAEGYLATGVAESDPATVWIAGRTYALSRINALTIPEDKLDISGMTENFEETISIHEYLPDNVKLADSEFNGRVNIKVYIEAIAEKTIRIPSRNISVGNLPDDFAYDIAISEPENGNYPLTIKGLRRLVNAISPDSVTGVINVKEWMESENIRQLKPGTYTVPISVTLGEDVDMGAAPRAEIVISEKE